MVAGVQLCSLLRRQRWHEASVRMLEMGKLGESGENPHEEDHVSNAPIYFRDRRRECLDGHNVRLYAKWGRACQINTTKRQI